MGTMKAVVIHEPGGPEVLRIEQVAIPVARQGDVLIRGGTTSVGLAAAAIAKRHGATVAATTRNPERQAMLRANGIEQVFIDSGEIAEQIREVHPRGVDKVLELVGTTTLKCSLRVAWKRTVLVER